MSEPATHPHAGSRSTLGVVMILMTLLGWSSVPLFLKHFANAIDAWTSNGWRYGFAALLWAPVIVIGAWRRSLPAGLWRAAVVPSLFNIAGQVCFTCAHYEIDPGLVTFGLRLQIVFVAVGAYLLFPFERRIIRMPGYLIGAALVFAGTLGVALPGGPHPSSTHAFGVTLAVASGFFFACYALSVRHAMQGTHPVTAFAAISLYTAGGMIALMLAFGARAGLVAWSLAPDQFGLLLLSAVIGIALGHVFYYTSITRLGVAISAGVVQLQPFLVTGASAVLFGERLTPGQWISGIVAVAGAALMLAVQQRITGPPSPPERTPPE